MNKFLLINSPIFWDTTNEDENYLSPLGLAYITTYLERSEFEVTIKDCVKDRISVSNLLEHINSHKYNFVGINIFTPNLHIVKHIIENIDSSCEIFIGGQIVKSLYSEITSFNTTNKCHIIIGEGEFIVPAIAKGNYNEIPLKVKGNMTVYEVNKNSKYFPEDISGIILNRKFLPNEITINHYGKKEASIITSRGCAYNCAFCGGARSLNQNISIRTRTPESILDEIRELISIYPDLQSVRILDDLFLRNYSSIESAKEIFSKLPELHWRGMIHALSIEKHTDKLNILSQANCDELFMGIESGSDRIRNKINKLGTIETVLETASAILKNGIDLKGYFILGFPEENKDDFEDTFSLACKLKEISQKSEGNFRASVFQFRPYHGTQLYNEIQEQGIVIPDCTLNEEISVFDGRTQFNFTSGNYSLETDDTLNDYIVKIQSLNNGE